MASVGLPIALTSPCIPDGISPALTAPWLLNFADVAYPLSDLTGRTISWVVIDDMEWIAEAIARESAAAVHRVLARNDPRREAR